MNGVPFSSPRILIRSAHVFAIALTFACVGPLIELALLGTVGHVAFTSFAMVTPFVIDLLPQRQFVQPILIPMAVAAGLTGLFAGVCDAVFRRVNIHSMLVISLVVVFVNLVFLAPLLTSGEVVWVILVSTTIQGVCFVTAMTACWKMVDLVRGKTPAAGSLTPT